MNRRKGGEINGMKRRTKSTTNMGSCGQITVVCIKRAEPSLAVRRGHQKQKRNEMVLQMYKCRIDIEDGMA